eukprot:SAG31_NODE_7896_length_1571_cov_1.545516_1_plen_159_part_00
MIWIVTCVLVINSILNQGIFAINQSEGTSSHGPQNPPYCRTAMSHAAGSLLPLSGEKNVLLICRRRCISWRQTSGILCARFTCSPSSLNMSEHEPPTVSCYVSMVDKCNDLTHSHHTGSRFQKYFHIVERSCRNPNGSKCLDTVDLSIPLVKCARKAA